MYEAIDRDVYIYRLDATIAEIGALVTRYRFKRSLIVYDEHLNQKDLETLEAGLARQGAEFLLLKAEEVTFCLIDEGYHLCLSEQIDSVIGIGGLNALDCAKGINILRFNDGNIQKYTNPCKRRNPGSGLFCAPLVEGDEEELLLTLKVMDNSKKEVFSVNCYCNYYIKVIET